MPGNESVTDNMKSFVGGVALKQAFYNMKTYNAQAISTAITNHNADAAHRHLPAVPTTSPPTGTFSYLTNSQTPAWSTLPTSDAVDSSSSLQLATSKAVSTLNTNINTINTRLSHIQVITKTVEFNADSVWNVLGDVYYYNCDPPATFFGVSGVAIYMICYWKSGLGTIPWIQADGGDHHPQICAHKKILTGSVTVLGVRIS